ncbi:MAG TPA: DUF3592 domain-containing protein [Caulobacteraceae bacterium]
MRPVTQSDLAVIGAIFGAGLGFILWVWLAWSHRVRLVERAQSWPTVRGRMQIAKVRHKRDSDAVDEFIPVISYVYEVAGRPYTGDRLHVGGKTIYYDDASASAAIQGYRSGGEVLVRYDPANPRVSALVVQPARTHLRHWLIFGAFLVLCAAYCAWAVTHR